MITSKTSVQEVEWKHPDSSPQKASLPAREVLFFYEGTQIQDFYFGDLIGIRYKTLEIQPLWRWFGWKDQIELEALCSDYLDLREKMKYPTKVVLLQKTPQFFFSKYWQKLFDEPEGNFILKRATLKVEYFSLKEPNSISLFCEDGKLVAR